MGDSLRLYWRYVLVSIRGQMQYRASFLMLSAAMFFGSSLEFLAIWVMFDRFGALQGWSLAEAALLYGLVNVAFALAEGAARGFDEFSPLVRTGQFDRLLLRPRSTALQVAGREVQMVRIGRLLQGLVILVWAATALGVAWTPGRILFCLATVAGGACLFAGLFVLQATFCFWSTESLEVFNTVTYGGVETAQYPFSLYRAEFRRFFTYVIPLATVTYYPALAILDKPDPLGSSRLLQHLAPLLGVAFLLVALQVWRFGERRYRSTGS
jgi:ABC-2 type transport system permease protein